MEEIKSLSIDLRKKEEKKKVIQPKVKSIRKEVDKWQFDDIFLELDKQWECLTAVKDGLTEFPPNGATKGDTGLITQIDKHVTFYADNDTICGGGSVTITPTIIGVIPSGQLNWYNSYTSTAIIHTGNTFTTPILNTTTTYYFGACGIPFRDSVTIFASPTIIIDTISMIVQHETCAGDDGSITGITATGGFGMLSYYWNNSLSQYEVYSSEVKVANNQVKHLFKFL